jgi:hypothetical protein
MDKELLTSIDKLRRIKNLKRFQLFDYRKKPEYNQYEEILSNMDISKRQLDVINESFLPRFREAKNTLKSGLEHLFIARTKIMESLAL